MRVLEPPESMTRTDPPMAVGLLRVLLRPPTECVVVELRLRLSEEVEGLRPVLDERVLASRRDVVVRGGTYL